MNRFAYFVQQGKRVTIARSLTPPRGLFTENFIRRFQSGKDLEDTIKKDGVMLAPEWA